MEDLKRYMKVVSKYSFWIISGLLLILSSVVFYLTKSSLDESIKSRITALESSFSKISEVSNKATTHPNTHSQKEMDKRLMGLQEDVDRAWEFQYDRQKGLLTWPMEAFREPRTHEIFDNLRPFEKMVPFPLPSPIPEALDKETRLSSITENDRKVYRNYIEPEFPKLAQMIGSSWKFDLEGTATSAPGGFAPPGGAGGFAPPGFNAAKSAFDSRDLVRWTEVSQKDLATAVMPWFSRPSPPTIYEIYYAQEDIWILRGLMDIIAKTNAGANENFQAIVKEIEWIRTGSRASRDAGALWQEGAAGAQGGGSPYGGGGPPTGYSGGGGGGMPSGYGGSGGPGGGRGSETANAVRAAVQIDPADGRYLDVNFKPLTGAQLRAAMKLQNATDAVNAVAKRIPVRMRLKVDERFGRLITECGNGKMVLEVIQVRYNTDPAPDTASAAGSSSMSGGNKPSFGGAGGGGAGSMNEEMPTSGTGNAGPAANDLAGGETSIEIYGLIYLFNPPANLSGTNAAVTIPAPTAAVPPAAATPPAAEAGATGGNATAEGATPPASNDAVGPGTEPPPVIDPPAAGTETETTSPPAGEVPGADPNVPAQPANPAIDPPGGGSAPPDAATSQPGAAPPGVGGTSTDSGGGS